MAEKTAAELAAESAEKTEDVGVTDDQVDAEKDAAWGEFDQIDLAAAGKAAAAPAVDGKPILDAFAAAAGDPPAEAAKPAAVADPAAKPAEAKPAPVAAEDPLKDLPADHAARALIAQRDRDLAAANGRNAPVQKENARLRRELEAARKTAPAPAAAKAFALPGDPGWDEFKEKFPELAGPVEKRFDQAFKALDERIDSVVKPVRERVDRTATRVAETDSEAELNRAARELAKEHPDFVEIDGSPPFEAYLATLPPTVAALIDSDKAQDAAFLLRGYKASTFYTPPAPKPGASGDPPPPNGGTPKPANPPLDARRQRQLEGARTPRGGSTPAAAVTTIPNDPQGAWDAFERMGK